MAHTTSKLYGISDTQHTIWDQTLGHGIIEDMRLSEDLLGDHWWWQEASPFYWTCDIESVSHDAVSHDAVSHDALLSGLIIWKTAQCSMCFIILSQPLGTYFSNVFQRFMCPMHGEVIYHNRGALAGGTWLPVSRMHGHWHSHWLCMTMHARLWCITFWGSMQRVQSSLMTRCKVLLLDGRSD